MEIKKRYENIDICKGILILFVILTHGVSMTAAKEGYFRMWDGSVTMPSFFLLSGILYNHERWSRQGIIAFAVHRIQTLMVPYFFFELTGGAVVKILLGQWRSLNVFGLLHEFFLLLKNALTLKCNLGPDWFLPTLFFAELLLYITLSLEKKKRYLLYVCLSGALTLSAFYVHMGLPAGFLNSLMWRGTRILLAFIFLLIGVKEKKLFLPSEYTFWKVLVSFAIPSISVFLNGRCSMYAMNYRFLSLFLLSGCSGLFFLLAVASKIHSHLITYLGKGSLILLGTHSIAYTYIPLREDYAWPEPWSTFFLYLAAAAVLAAICLPVYPKLFPHLVGRKLMLDLRKQETTNTPVQSM